MNALILIKSSITVDSENDIILYVATFIIINSLFVVIILRRIIYS